MKPLEQWVKQREIGFTCQEVPSRPDSLMNDLPHHFKIRLSQGKRGFTLYFSQGSGITEPPTVTDVLTCITDDAVGYENNATFESWADEYGYDLDSRKAEKVYRATKRQAEQLKRMLGEDGYKYLIWDVMNAEREAESA